MLARFPNVGQEQGFTRLRVLKGNSETVCPDTVNLSLKCTARQPLCPDCIAKHHSTKAKTPSACPPTHPYYAPFMVFWCAGLI